MKFAKLYLQTAGLALSSLLGLQSASAAIAYSNLPVNPPFYNSTIGSTIFGPAQDPQNSGGSGSIAMSFVPNDTGTISVVILGITFNLPGDGNVNLFLAENPMTVAGMTT